MDGFIGDKIDMKDYIEKNKPDYVIVLYNYVGNSGNRYDFFD